MNDLNQKYVETRDERHFRIREQTQSHQVQTGNSFVTHLLTLSAGTLALSVSNLDKIAPHGILPENKWIVGVAWGSLIGSMILTIGCVGFGSLSFIRGIEQIDEIQSHWIKTMTPNNPQGENHPEHQNRNCWPFWSQTCGVVAVICLAVGLVFLAWFAIINLS